MTLPEDSGMFIKYRLLRVLLVRFVQVILKMESELLFVLGEKFISYDFPNGRRND
jgi:hypothetical protein